MVPRRVNQQTDSALREDGTAATTSTKNTRCQTDSAARNSNQGAAHQKCSRATFKAVPSSPQAQILLEKRTAFVRVA